MRIPPRTSGLPAGIRGPLRQVERLLANANKRTEQDHTQRAAFWNAQEHLANLYGVYNEGGELTEGQRTRIYEACLADFPDEGGTPC